MVPLTGHKGLSRSPMRGVILIARGMPALIAMAGILLCNAVSQDQLRPSDGDRRQRANFVGDDACLSCHRELSIGYSLTQHHLTSQLPNATSILGAFSEGSNTLKIATPAPIIGDPGISYRMESRDNGYYQTAITGFTGAETRRSERMDVVIGSGVRGQSYLYWRGDQLFELPVSYWTDGHQWINSPGYRNGPPNFDRAASPRCLECHVTYIAARSTDPQTNRYDRSTLATGISCERCHGPALAHIATRKLKVSAQTAPGADTILNPAKFPRDRQVDVCAQCHGGAGQRNNGLEFSYVPGEPLERYLHFDPIAAGSRPDVHANQVGLLKKSRCYLSSPEMSCSTCHEVHSPERAAASYSAKCLRCHQAESCGMEKTIGHKILDNCIDCHMPVQETSAIVSETADKLIRTSMRTHWIKVYR